MATCTPDRRSGVDGGRGQVAFSSPVLDSARSPRSPGGDRVDVRGVTGGRSPDKFSREEVIMFGGIPDQAAEGRRMSCRLQSHPEVDDMQQRCAARAAKLRDVQVTTGVVPGYGADPYLVLTHSDGGQGAFGYWICPVGDGCAGYLQPVWMAIM
ncbi:uncharacterized protein LOC119362295 [Triticum dicoccoides]|nr:uncharacterized protein LOC119362295 [Triticum dicoccoides]